MQPQPEPEMRELGETLRAAAAMLEGAPIAAGPAHDLLRRLDYLASPTEQASHRAALLRAAAKFRRLFVLQAVDAPGLVALGAEADPASVGAAGPVGGVSGTGLSFREAFESCVGEGVEYLSQFAAPGDPEERMPAATALDGTPQAVAALWQRLQPYRRNPGAEEVGWTAAADLADGHPVWLPFDLCFRRPPAQRDLDPPWLMGTGCGAGVDHLAATLHGLLELIERDAIALWWRGAQSARLPPPGAGAALLARLRGGAGLRQTWLLDVTSDTGVPVAVAASCNSDGFGLCCGHAAGLTLASAADAAVRELAQMELAWRLSDTKRSTRGESALNDVDRQHLRRFTTIDVLRTPALQPLAPPALPRDLPACDGLAALAELRHRLAAAGLAPCALNLTRPALGVAVTRVICPGLEPGLNGPPGPRLLAAAALTGSNPTTVAPL